MKFFIIIIAVVMIVAGSAYAQDNLGVNYEHTTDGYGSLYLQYSWPQVWSAVFLADDYYEAYLGHEQAIGGGLVLYASMVAYGSWSPVKVNGLMPEVIVYGRGIEWFNNFTFPCEPALSFGNQSNFDDIRWSWAPFRIKNIQFGPLLDGNLSLYHHFE
ncbi:MAG: hypothetical protein V1838_00355 [Patescibacteria group bacterium]